MRENVPEMEIDENMAVQLAGLGFFPDSVKGLYIREKSKDLPEIQLKFSFLRNNRGERGFDRVIGEYVLDSAGGGPLYLLLRNASWTHSGEIVEEIRQYLMKQEIRARMRLALS